MLRVLFSDRVLRVPTIVCAAMADWPADHVMGQVRVWATQTLDQASVSMYELVRRRQVAEERLRRLRARDAALRDGRSTAGLSPSRREKAVARRRYEMECQRQRREARERTQREGDQQAARDAVSRLEQRAAQLCAQYERSSVAGSGDAVTQLREHRAMLKRIHARRCAKHKPTLDTDGLYGTDLDVRTRTPVEVHVSRETLERLHESVDADEMLRVTAIEESGEMLTVRPGFDQKERAARFTELGSRFELPRDNGYHENRWLKFGVSHLSKPRRSRWWIDKFESATGMLVAVLGPFNRKKAERLLVKLHLLIPADHYVRLTRVPLRRKA